MASFDRVSLDTAGGRNTNDVSHTGNLAAAGNGETQQRPLALIIEEVHAIEDAAKAKTNQAYTEARAMMVTRGVEAGEAHYQLAIERENAIRNGPEIARLMSEAETSVRACKAKQTADQADIKQRAEANERTANMKKQRKRDIALAEVAKKAAKRAKTKAKLEAKH